MNVDTAHAVDLNFTFLPDYARFLKDNLIRQLVVEQIRLAKELHIPLLKYFTHLTDEALIAFSITTSGELLDYLIENNAAGQINDALSKWVNNQIPELSRAQVKAEDITLVNYMRKQAMLHFIGSYTSDVSTILGIANELDRFAVASETKTFNIYNGLVGKHLNEQVDFVEKINDTSPGIIYVLDLAENKIVYANRKVSDLLGYSPNEIESLGENFISSLRHPDDESAAEQHLKNFSSMRDGEVRTLRQRLQHKQGDYRWMNNYETVFKRNGNGLPSQIICITLDIDDLEKTSARLMQREEQLLQAQELAEIGSFEWNLNTFDGMTTPELLKILEYKDKKELNQFSSRIHPEDRSRVLEITSKAWRESGIYDYECRFMGYTHQKILWAKGSVSKTDGASIVKGTIMDVTKRHLMVEQLQLSDRLFKEAQALTHIGNWTWFIDTNMVTWSDELYRIYELEPQSEEMSVEKITTFIHPDDKESNRKFLAESVTQQQPADYLYKIVTRNNNTKILQIKSEVRFDENNKAVKMIGTCQDVTTQKLAEKQLLENQLFIQKIADAAPSIIVSLNIHTGKYSFVSQGLKKLLGYEPVTLLNEGVGLITKLIHPDDMPLILKKNREAIKRSNEPQQPEEIELISEYQFRALHSNGTYKWLQTFGTVFDRNEKGEVENVLNIAIDITENIEKEKKLLDQEHFINHIAEASPTILYLFDLVEKRFIYINKEVKLALGYEPEEVLELGNKVMAIFLHPDDDIKAPDNYVKFSKAEGAPAIHQFEGRVKHKNNKWVWMLTREIVFKRDEAGRPVQVLGSALDITRRKEAEQALVYKTHQLQQSNASLEEFAHVASHDLQEPLRKISTFGNRLVSTNKEVINKEGLIYLEKIIQYTARMQRLISDILSISVISAEQNFVWYNLENLLDDVLQTLEFKVDEKQAIVTSDHLPMAMVNPSQFRQLFQNLLSNSLKFTRPGVKARITVKHEYTTATGSPDKKLRNASKYLSISFTDNGIGFENMFADKIFSMFQRLNGQSAYEGTGIGLAICKKIVENHGGYITAKGNPGEGATFNILLPVQ